ncbi:MAG: NAD(P)/FAD-dependent oxidoreductase [Aestuariivirga sp.]
MEPVVIIGAGMAGAAAALKLSKAGIVPLVLEAQERIGGRAYSRPYASAQDASLLEYGGSWITAYHDRIRALVPEMGLTLRPRAAITQRLALRDGELGAPHFSSSDERRAHERAIARVAADAILYKKGLSEDEMGRPLLGITYKAYLDRVNPPEATRHMLDAWWTVSGSGAHDVIAASEFLSSCAYGGGLAENTIDAWSDTVEPGMSVLAERMLNKSGAKLRLSCPVAAIQHDTGHAIVTTQAGAVLTARNVILAIGVNPLQAISFVPSLPASRSAAITRGHGGRAFKLWIKARGVSVGTLITGDGQGIELLFAERAAPDGSVLLIGFGLQLGNAEPGNEAWVLEQFKRVVPNAEFISYDWHDWISDSHARGTWVSTPADMGEAFECAAWEPFGRLAFASSDYAPDQAGWFEGAVKSGEAAAAWAIAGAS